MWTEQEMDVKDKAEKCVCVCVCVWKRACMSVSVGGQVAGIQVIWNLQAESWDFVSGGSHWAGNKKTIWEVITEVKIIE